MVSSHFHNNQSKSCPISRRFNLFIEFRRSWASRQYITWFTFLSASDDFLYFILVIRKQKEYVFHYQNEFQTIYAIFTLLLLLYFHHPFQFFVMTEGHDPFGADICHVSQGGLDEERKMYDDGHAKRESKKRMKLKRKSPWIGKFRSFYSKNSY